MYLCTIILSTAVFYGIEHKICQDITASMLISVLGKLPVKLIKWMFTKSKPNIMKRSEKYTVDEHKKYDQMVRINKNEEIICNNHYNHCIFKL